MRSAIVRPQDNARQFRFGPSVLIVLFALVAMPITALADEAPAEEAVASAEADAAADPNAVGAPMACGELAAERYPFLTCVRGPSGGPVFASTGEGITAGHIEIRSKFVRAKGHWGPSGIE